jgi:hypothetical protein
MLDLFLLQSPFKQKPFFFPQRFIKMIRLHVYINILLFFLPSSANALVVKSEKRGLIHRIIHRNNPPPLIVNQGYVPDGLTAQEYTAIKQKEAESIASKNFGAWGPRFQRTDRPDGDWMVLPELWISGAAQRPSSISSSSTLTENWNISIVFSFITACMVLEVMWTAAMLQNVSQLPRRTAIRDAFVSLFQRKLPGLVLWKASSIRLALSLLLTIPIRWSIKRLFGYPQSTRSVVIASIGTAVGLAVGLASWALILCRV